MALVNPVIIQIVGFQNSGKTTFISKIIQKLKEQGIKSATIKHHGHGGKPDLLAEKDSEKHIVAGAIATLVEGDGRLILQCENNLNELDHQIALLSFFQPDVILIEGHKQKDYPKLVMIRNNHDLPLLQLTNIKAVICWEDTEIYKTDISVTPLFSIHDEAVINWTIDFLQTSISENIRKQKNR
ncbi:molybdopterin-guanine dinucleotide biosynthesis protein B [Neobacillus sp. LXY-1]|uniref:molybdopterin-guanine dinucleotide biosynthesis protein B n=1 Tax=Neobacillus sp. LXY-1 TaxID=3379133 RepID=UPI003EE04A36